LRIFNIRKSLTDEEESGEERFIPAASSARRKEAPRCGVENIGKTNSPVGR
jgi:hypothetical protein